MDNKKNLFVVLPEFQEIYNYYTNIGKQEFINKDIVIVGLARNLEGKIKQNIHNLHNFFMHAKNISYFIYENDSEDSTPQILSEIKQEIKNFDFISEKLNLKKFGSVKSKERTHRLAEHRNKCLEYIKIHHSSSDYTCVIDLDYDNLSFNGVLNSIGHLKQISIDGIVGNSFQFKNSFDTISFDNNLLWNYDSWAFRFNWWEDLQNYSQYFSIDPMLWFGLFCLPIGSNPFRINSGFGGLGIYKTKKYILGKYSGDDCEHVCFHKYLSENADFKLYMNPSQVMVF
jgi:hypothetical protein